MTSLRYSNDSKTRISTPVKSALACGAIASAIAMYGCFNETIMFVPYPNQAAGSASGKTATAASLSVASKMASKPRVSDSDRASLRAVANAANSSQTAPTALSPLQSSGYDAAANPLALNPSLESLAEEASKLKTTREKVAKIFEALRVGGTSGVKFDDDNTMRPPRTALVTLAKGGQCDDLALLWIALANKAGIRGGVKVVHFKDSPADLEHMIAYAVIDGKKTLIDLQLERMGKTKNSNYDERSDTPSEQALWVYHQKWGDYCRSKEDRGCAENAYRNSLNINPVNTYALIHFSAVIYQDRFDRGIEAFEAKDFRSCGPLFREAERAGKKAQETAGDKSPIKASHINDARSNAVACEHNLAQTGGNK